MENFSVRNASNEKQVREAKKKEKRGREHELEDIKQVLNTPSGRRFVWRILNHCKTFESIWHSSALIHHNSGMQDVGHFILSEISESSEELLFELMKDNYKKKGELKNV